MVLLGGGVLLAAYFRGRGREAAPAVELDAAERERLRRLLADDDGSGPGMSGLVIPAFVVLTTIAVLAVLWPVFRRPRPAQRERYEIEVYRDQLAEVERDRERGLIPAAEARAAQIEIERRLLRSGSAAEAADRPGVRPARDRCWRRHSWCRPWRRRSTA